MRERDDALTAAISLRPAAHLLLRSGECEKGYRERFLAPHVSWRIFSYILYRYEGYYWLARRMSIRFLSGRRYSFRFRSMPEGAIAGGLHEMTLLYSRASVIHTRTPRHTSQLQNEARQLLAAVKFSSPLHLVIKRRHIRRQIPPFTLPIQ